MLNRLLHSQLIVGRCSNEIWASPAVAAETQSDNAFMICGSDKDAHSVFFHGVSAYHCITAVIINSSNQFPGTCPAIIRVLVYTAQLFNAAGQIYSDRRSNLHGVNAEKLLFLLNFNYWLPYFFHLQRWLLTTIHISLHWSSLPYSL